MSHPKCAHRRRAAIVCAVLAAGLPLSSDANTYFWDTGSGLWSNGANWSDTSTTGGTVGTAPGPADQATFNQSSVNGAETIQLDADAAALALLFRNTGATVLRSDTATPRILTLGAGGIVLNAGTGAVTIGNAANILNLSLAAPQTWTNNASNPLTVVNGVSLANAGAQTLTIGGSGNTTFSGIVSNGSGILGLGKTGTGTLVLGNSSNTFTGATNISGGTVSIAADTALGTAPGAATPNAIVIDNTNAFGAQLSTTATFTLAANRGIGLGSATAGSGGGINVASGTTLTYGGIIANNGGANALILTGGGRLLLNGASTYTGGTTIASGTTLQIGDGTTNGSISATGTIVNNGTLDIRTSATARTFSSAVSGRGNVVVSGTGAGITTISGANTYTGTTVIGTLNNGAIQGTIALGTSPFGVGGTVTVNSGTTGGTGSYLQLGNGTTTTGVVTGKTLILNSGNTNFRVALFASTNTGTNAWNGDIITAGAGGAQVYNNTSGGTLQLGASAANTITGVAGMSFRGSASTANGMTVNSTFNLTAGISKTDAGSTVLLNSPYNVWTTTQLSLATMKLGVNDAMPPTTTLSIGQAASTSATFDLNGKQQTLSGLTDSLATTTSSTSITSSAAGGVFILNNATANTYGSAGAGGVFTGGINLAVVKQGVGTFTLNSKAVNTYTGGTTVNAGTFVEDFANLATPTNLLDATSALILGGGTLQVTAKASAATAQTFSSLTVNGAGSGVVANNTVTGTPSTLINLGAITRGSLGTVAFTLPGGARAATNGIVTSSANNASGILGGWATVGSDWAAVDTTTGNTITAFTGHIDVNRSNGQIADGATNNVRIIEDGSAGGLAPLAAGTTTISTLLQNAGSTTYSSAATDVLRLGAAGGVLVANGAGALTLGDTANNGILTAGGADNTGGSISFTNNSAAALAVNLTITNNGSGAVTVNKSGTGTLALNGTNTYTGGTSIGGGTVTLGDASALGNANSILSINAGTLNLNGFSIGVGQLVGNGGSITNSAAAATLTVGNNGGVGTFYGTIGGAISLSKTSTGTITVAGNNTYTGTTTIATGGTLQIGAGGSTGTLGGGAVTNNGTLAFNRADAMTVANAISGSGGISQIGRGTVTLTAANTYGGLTTISAGTLTLSGGDNRLPTGTTLAFSNTVPFATWINLGSTNQTISSMTFPGVTMTAYFSGTGKLTANVNTLQIGSNTAPAPYGNVTVDMSALANFEYTSTSGTFRMGYLGASSGSLSTAATVTLAAANTISVNSINMSELDAGGNSGSAVLHLGTANNLNATNIMIGGNPGAGSSRGNGFVDFASGLTNPSVRFRGTNGLEATPVTTFIVGRVTNNGATALTSSVDLSAGSVDALVTNMIVGSADIKANATRQGNGTYTFTMGAGTFNVTSLTVGQIAGTATNGVNPASTLAVTGILNLNNAAGTLNAATLNLATNTIADTTAGTAKTVNGTVNLIDGTIKATNIQKGSQTGTATSVTTNFNWTTGTIQNTDLANLTVTSVPMTLLTNAPHTFNISGSQTGTVASTSIISGAGGISKTGTGTLLLAAANTYTGGTSITNGLALVNANNSAATGAVAVAAGGTLGGNGTVGGATTITGTIAPGASASGSGTLSLASTLAFVPGGAYAFELSTAGTPSETPGGSTPTVPQTNHDLISGTGALNFANATVNVTSLGSTGFDQSSGYSWLIATSPAGVSGTPTLGTIGGTSFTGYSGTFSLTTDANNVYLNYAVPEPGSLALATASIGMLALRRRRRH